MAHKLLSDSKHWLGWAISSAVLTTAVILFYHLLQAHVVHTPIWRAFALFGIIFFIEVFVDVIKHYTRLQ